MFEMGFEAEKRKFQRIHGNEETNWNFDSHWKVWFFSTENALQKTVVLGKLESVKGKRHKLECTCLFTV